jgi:hypothetical protein
MFLFRNDWPWGDPDFAKASPGQILRCSESREMSNMIALVSLDFGGTGSMCGIGIGVDADGRAFS